MGPPIRSHTNRVSNPCSGSGSSASKTALRSLFREPMHVDTIYVSGLTMNIPPKNDRQQMSNIQKHDGKMSMSSDRSKIPF